MMPERVERCVLEGASESICVKGHACNKSYMRAQTCVHKVRCTELHMQRMCPKNYACTESHVQRIIGADIHMRNQSNAVKSYTCSISYLHAQRLLCLSLDSKTLSKPRAQPAQPAHLLTAA
ncbi:TPA: hypothetical protein ACH3X3_15258 [Trebouxia sp. C0006]